MSDDVEAIVRSLTKAQRSAIIEACDQMSSHKGYPFFTVAFVGEPWPEGVAQFLTFGTDRLTPLGLRVRQSLLSQAKE